MRQAPTAPGTTVIAPSLRQRAPLEILRGDIFQRLPFGDDVDPVADLGIAGDRGELVVAGEPARQTRDRLRLELRVGVERDDDLALRDRAGRD